MKPCIYCGEQIQDAAVKCRFCGEWLDASKRPDAAVAAAPAPTRRETPAADGHELVLADPRASEAPRMVGARTDLWIGAGQTDMSIPPGDPHLAPPAAPLPAAPPPAAPPPAWTSQGLTGELPRSFGQRPLDPLAGDPHHIPTLLPEPEARPPSERSDLAAVEVVGGFGVRAPSPSPAASSSAPLSFTPLVAEIPPPPPPAPPGAFQARSADAFEQAFLGGGDLDAPLDGEGDDPFGASMAAPPPAPPWPLIAVAVAAVLLLGGYAFRDALFGPAEAVPEVAAEDAKAEPPPAASPPPTPPPEVKAAADAKALAEARPPEIKPPPAPSDPEFADRLARAKAAYSGGKLKAASAALQDLSRQAPDHPEVLLLTAQVQLEEGKLPESQATATRCVELDPKLADCWLTLGVLRQNNKDDAGALAAYETYLKLAPTGRYARDANSQLARLRRAAG